MWLATSISLGCTMSDNRTPIRKADRSTSLQLLLEPFFGPFFAHPDVTEICVNRPGEIWAEATSEWGLYEEPALTLDVLKSIATAAASYVFQKVEEEKPLLSATLPKEGLFDGARLQVVVPPACEPGTVSLTIRKPAKIVRSLSAYAKNGFFEHLRFLGPSEAKDCSSIDAKLLSFCRERNYLSFFREAVQAQKTIVVAGETGSGKTTFMKALMEEIPPSERILTIEDVPELSLPYHPNSVRLFYPSEAKEGDPVTAASLLRSCLRMKPTRILLAELRGAETFDFLNVASSGHGGTITSCHAGSVALTFERLGLMVLQNPQGQSLPHSVITRLLHQIVDIVVHVHNDAREGGHGRHVTELWFDPLSKRTQREVA